MPRAERGNIFTYTEHKPYIRFELLPRHTTEEQFKDILKSCVGTESTLFMQTSTKSVFIPPKGFIQAQALSPEDREKFLTLAAQTMKEAEKVTVRAPTFSFSKN